MERAGSRLGLLALGPSYDSLCCQAPNRLQSNVPKLVRTFPGGGRHSGVKVTSALMK